MDEAKQVLIDSADKLPSLQGKCVSEGKLNVGRALALARTINYG